MTTTEHTDLPTTPTVPLPVQPQPVQSAIDELSRVFRNAQCVRAGIVEGQRWGWDQREPSPLRPLPTLDEYLAAERSRIEDAGVQIWDETLEQKARAGWEDLQELYDDELRHREHHATWQKTILQYWADLMGAIPEAQSAIRAIKPHLGEVVEHPGAWVTGTLESLGYLAALRVSWGERPWVGDPEDLQGPLPDLLQRMSRLQRADFTVQPDSGGNPENNAGDSDEMKAPSLTENESQVLTTMARYDPSQLLSIARINTEMDATERLSERTIGPIVRKLINLDLAERPEGRSRSGAKLTRAGRKLASKIAD